MVQENRRNLDQAELLRRQETTVAGDYLASGIDEDGHIETERLDAARDLADLLRAMFARILWIEFQLGDRPINDRETSLGLDAGCSAGIR
jgi:hypothetical protein